jgi:hypothetical protein
MQSTLAQSVGSGVTKRRVKKIDEKDFAGLSRAVQVPSSTLSLRFDAVNLTSTTWSRCSHGECSHQQRWQSTHIVTIP